MATVRGGSKIRAALRAAADLMEFPGEIEGARGEALLVGTR
jgi:hypothetical protein